MDALTTPLSPVVGPTALDVDKPQRGLRAQARVKIFRRLELIDQALSQKLHLASFGWGDIIVLIPAFLFSSYAMPVLIIFFLFIMPLGFWIELLASCLLTLATVLIMKKRVGRIRPGPHTLARKIFNLRSLEKNNAMPSGDSAQSALFCVLLAVHFNEPRLLLGIPATMFGRVYFGCHWIGDTIVGASIGAAIALAVHHAFDLLCGICGFKFHHVWLAHALSLSK